MKIGEDVCGICGGVTVLTSGEAGPPLPRRWHKPGCPENDGSKRLRGTPLDEDGAIKFFGTVRPLTCACCGEVSTNPGQFVKDGRWVCTEECRKNLPNADSYDDLAASDGIVDAP